MLYFLVFLSAFLLAVTIKWKRFILHALAENSVAMVNALLQEGEDDEKIDLIEKSTTRLFGSLMRVLLLILLACVLAAIPLFAFYWFRTDEFLAFDFWSLYSILAISLGATLPFLFPNKRNNSSYSELSQLLHRMSLNNYRISEKLFKIEVKRNKESNTNTQPLFVIVTGLARAGTTSLMNDLAKTDAFSSLSYANMPFLMSPNLWAKFYKPKKVKEVERSHKDGIKIGLDSNEALEEYFFKVKTNDSFISDESLHEHQLKIEDYQDYIDYQNLVRSKDKVYLAKNNNFVLRYNSIRQYNPHFVTVVLFREPLAHASSLLEKHLYYSKLQDKDPFVLEYMDWLGHHEFGVNQKPFQFNDGFVPTGDKSEIDFWLQSWYNYYNHILNLDDNNLVLVDYNHYCNDPNTVISEIIALSKIERYKMPDLKAFSNKRKPESKTQSPWLEKCNEVHEILKSRSLLNHIS